MGWRPDVKTTLKPYANCHTHKHTDCLHLAEKLVCIQRETVTLICMCLCLCTFAIVQYSRSNIIHMHIVYIGSYWHCVLMMFQTSICCCCCWYCPLPVAHCLPPNPIRTSVRWTRSLKTTHSVFGKQFSQIIAVPWLFFPTASHSLLFVHSWLLSMLCNSLVRGVSDLYCCCCCCCFCFR